VTAQAHAKGAADFEGKPREFHSLDVSAFSRRCPPFRQLSGALERPRGGLRFAPPKRRCVSLATDRGRAVAKAG
jgi:hypothetical protein